MVNEPHILQVENMRKRLSIEISEHMHENLKKLAKSKGITLTFLVRQTMVKCIVNEWFIPNKYPEIASCNREDT